MLENIQDQFWHRWLGQPYYLRLAIDRGTGTPVVLLHGIGSSGNTWQNAASALPSVAYRIIAPDLLGFGDSPKPLWPEYTVDDHARAVITTLRRAKVHRPVILVGHSMGCLVAVRIAVLRPDLVKHLILYQMPLYSGLPDSRRYNVRRDFFFKIYRRVTEWPADVAETGLRNKVMRMTGLKLTPATWQPFVRSLRSTIMEQTTLQDLYNLRLPMDIVYGSLDMVVIRGKPKKIFARVLAPLQTHTIAQVHGVSPRASTFIAKRIAAAATESPVEN